MVGAWLHHFVFEDTVRILCVGLSRPVSDLDRGKSVDVLVNLTNDGVVSTVRATRPALDYRVVSCSRVPDAAGSSGELRHFRGDWPGTAPNPRTRSIH